MDHAEICLDETYFKLNKISIENNKIKRNEMKIIVDPKSFVYMINDIATVICKIPNKLKNGIYESCFGGNVKINDYSFNRQI